MDKQISNVNMLDHASSVRQLLSCALCHDYTYLFGLCSTLWQHYREFKGSLYIPHINLIRHGARDFEFPAQLCNVMCIIMCVCNIGEHGDYK